MRGILELVRCSNWNGFDPFLYEMIPIVVAISIYIEALVLSPNIEREGSQQRPF